MKIQLVSDIHFEHYRNVEHSQNFDYSQIITNSENADMLVMAGDIGFYSDEIFQKFIEYTANLYKYVLFVPGNHDYHMGHQSIGEIDNELRALFRPYGNVYFLNNESIILENINFIGTTLWCEVTNTMTPIADVSIICPKNANELGTPSDYTEMWKKSLTFIRKTMSSSSPSDHIVVITHHLPTYKCIDKKYMGMGTMCKWFATDCEQLMWDDPHPDLWLCGHTHINNDLTINKTRIVTNPVGYPEITPTKVIFENKQYIEKYIIL